MFGSSLSVVSYHAVTELAWERPLTVLNYPDPRLRAPNARIGVFDDRLRQLAAEMFDVMYRRDPTPPLCLSAPWPTTRDTAL